MSAADIRGTLSISTSAANSALKLLSKTTRDVGTAGTAMSKAQTRAMSAIKSAAASATAQQTKLETSFNKSRKAAQDLLDQQKKIRQFELNEQQGRASKRANDGNKGKITDARVGKIGLDAAGNADVAEAKRILLAKKAVTEEIRQQIMLVNQKGKVAVETARAAVRAAKEEEKAKRAVAAAQGEQMAALNSARYALYDITRTAAVAGAAMVAAFVAPIAGAVQWERQFANVQRTFGGTGDQIKPLRAAFVDLAQTIPETFEDLTKIGTLANQIGIKPDQVVNFTEIVAKFGTTTGVSVEESATAFGRLNSLIPDVQNNFQGLADSVLKVGVNSVSTEAQILKISTQISSITAASKFGYKETVGFAGALASIAVPPELSRGVTTRVFGTLNRAISDGGIKLERFAKLSGMSSSEFKNAWSADAAGTFQRFMEGIRKQGGNAEASIRALGITSVRDVPILLRLANAADSAGKAGGLLAQTMGDAASAAGTLDTQYAIVADTIAAKIQVLTNTVQSLMDAAGSNSLGIIGDLLDGFTKRLKDLADFASSPIGQVIVGITAAIVGLGAVLLLGAAIVGKGLTTYIALIAAINGITIAGQPAAFSMATLNASLAATGPLGAKAASAIKLVGVALKSLAVVGVVLALPEISGWAQKSLQAVGGLDNTFAGLIKQIKTVPKDLLGNDTDSYINSIAKMDDFTRGLGRTLSDLNISWEFASNSVKKLDDELVKIGTNNGAEALRKSFEDVAAAAPELTLKQLLDTLPETAKYLKENGISAKLGAEGIVSFTDAAGNAVEPIIELTDAEQEADQATKDMLETFATADGSFINFSQALTNSQDRIKAWAQEQADATEDGGDSWEDFAGSFEGSLNDYLTGLEQMVVAQNNWETNIAKLKLSGISDEALGELTKLGVDGAPLVQQFVDDIAAGGTDAMQRLENAVAEGAPGATAAFAAAVSKFGPALGDALQGVGATSGQGVVDEIITKLLGGGYTFAQIVAEYNLDVPASVVADVDGITLAEAVALLNEAANPRTSDFKPRVLTEWYGEAVLLLNDAATQREVPYLARIPAREYTEADKRLNDAAKQREVPFLGRADTVAVENAMNEIANRSRNIWFNVNYRVPAAPPSFAAPTGNTGGVVPKYFATGGIAGRSAGPRGKDTVPAWLQPGEGVVRLGAMNALGPKMFDAINNADRGGFAKTSPIVQGTSSSYASQKGAAASGPTVVELSPYDRSLLEAAGNLEFIIPGVTIAKATNRNNIAETRKGGG